MFVSSQVKFKIERNVYRTLAKVNKYVFVPFCYILIFKILKFTPVYKFGVDKFLLSRLYNSCIYLLLVIWSKR